METSIDSQKYHYFDENACLCNLCKEDFKLDFPKSVYFNNTNITGEKDLNRLCYYNLLPNQKRIDVLKDIRNLIPKKGKILEVGCHVGFITNALLAYDIQIYAIDLWDDNYYNDADGGKGGIIETNRNLGGALRVYQRFIHNTSKDLFKRVFPLRGESVYLSHYLDLQFDMIYIDAAHDYQSAKKDIFAWYPKLKKNGVMAGDDFSSSGVKQAVDEVFGGNKTVYADQWIVRKIA